MREPKSLTILIRGGTQRIVDEAERSLKDAINVVKDVIVEGKVIPGGGAGELEVASSSETMRRRFRERSSWR